MPAALDSNCGGVPCTASEKEDSTTTDHIPGEPHTPTEDSEETEPEPTEPVSDEETEEAEIESGDDEESNAEEVDQD